MTTMWRTDLLFAHLKVELDFDVWICFSHTKQRNSLRRFKCGFFLVSVAFILALPIYVLSLLLIVPSFSFSSSIALFWFDLLESLCTLVFWFAISLCLFTFLDCDT